MDHKCGNADGGQDVPNVELRVHSQQRDGRAWTRRPAEVRSEPAREGLVTGLAWDVMLEVHQLSPFILDHCVFPLVTVGFGGPGIPETLNWLGYVRKMIRCVVRHGE